MYATSVCRRSENRLLYVGRHGLATKMVQREQAALFDLEIARDMYKPKMDDYKGT